MQLNFNFGKFLLPGVEQFHRVAAGDGEQQFKILAIGQRGGERRLCVRSSASPTSFAAREIGIADLQQFRADAAGLQNVAQIAGQPVAQVNHRVDGKMFRQPARLFEPRLELQMLFRQRAAEFAGHKNGVAGFRAGAQDLFSARDGSQQRDGNENAVRGSSSSRRRRSPRRIFPRARSGRRKFAPRTPARTFPAGRG